MKIRTEQLLEPQEAEARRIRTNRSADSFGDLLTRQLDADQPQGVVSLENSGSLAPGVLTMPLPGMMDGDAAPSGKAVAEKAVGQMESMFSTFERYADELALNQKADLRSAYGLLERMRSQIAGFKANFPDAGAQQPELASMLNELDVMVTTETFKFNRGDYL